MEDDQERKPFEGLILELRRDKKGHTDKGVTTHSVGKGIKGSKVLNLRRES